MVGSAGYDQLPDEFVAVEPRPDVPRPHIGGKTLGRQVLHHRMWHQVPRGEGGQPAGPLVVDEVEVESELVQPAVQVGVLAATDMAQHRPVRLEQDEWSIVATEERVHALDDGGLGALDVHLYE